MWKPPKRANTKSKKFPLVVNGSPAHKIISATSVDFGARRRAGQQWNSLAGPMQV